MTRPTRPAPRGLTGLLLRLLPVRFRGQYGEEMAGVIRDQEQDARRSGRRALLRFRLQTIGGLSATLVRLNGREILRDAGFAARQSARSPGFTVGVVLTLAVGIGALTAVFTTVHAVLLAPLPYRDAGDLVVLQEERSDVSGRASLPRMPRALEVQAAAEATNLFESVVTFSSSGGNVTGGDRPEWVLTASTSTNVFETLGLSPHLGRGFRPGETHVVVLTHELWRRLFGGRADVLERTISIEGVPSRCG